MTHVLFGSAILSAKSELKTSETKSDEEMSKLSRLGGFLGIELHRFGRTQMNAPQRLRADPVDCRPIIRDIRDIRG